MERTKVYRYIAVLAALALLAAACTGGDDDPAGDATTTTEPEDDTSTTGDQTTTTADDGQVPGLIDPDDEDHSIIDGRMLLVEDDALAIVAQAAEELGVGVDVLPLADDSDALREFLSSRYLRDPLAEDAFESELVRAAFDGLNLTVLDEGFARELLRATEGEGGVHPVHFYEFEGHWTIQPGTVPRIGPPSAEAEAIAAELDEERQRETMIVAVVDSGFVPDATFVTFDDPLDVEQPNENGAPNEECFVSHGTFVAGLVRHTDPGAVIVGSRAQPLTESGWAHATAGHGARLPGPGVADGGCNQVLPPENMPEEAPVAHDRPMTDDIAIFLAVARAYGMADERQEELGLPIVMNLSFGTYGFMMADELKPPSLLGFATGWLARNEVQVFASAGNQDLDQPFYPAAFDSVVGVGALDENGSWVRWTADGTLVANSPAGLSWMGGFAPGCDLLGLGRPGLNELIAWSGSSFASPLAAVMTAGTSTTQTYGPNQTLADYNAIPQAMLDVDAAGFTRDCP